MKKAFALIVFLSALHVGMVGLATALGQATPNDLLAFTTSQPRTGCGAEIRPYNIYIADTSHQLVCNLTGMETYGILAGWSPDGARAAFDSGGTVTITDSRMREVARFEQSYFPSWSVNGTLMFENLVGNIFTVDQNGDNRLFLTSNGVTGTRPRWSLDGTRVVFECILAICVVDADGENLREATLSAETAALDSISFDNGEMLVYQHNSLYLIDHNDGQMRRILRDYIIYSPPLFSFDGRQVAFYSSGDMNIPTITVINIANGSEQYLLSGLPAPDSLSGKMAWSPDSRQLAFELNGIYVADTASGSVREVCTLCGNPVWVPDPVLYAMITES